MDNSIVDKPLDDSKPEYTISNILKLRIQGKTFQQIADIYKKSKQAIHQQIQGLYEYLDKDQLQAFRERKIDILDALEHKFLSEAVKPSRMKRASSRDMVVNYGIISDKNRLEQGKSSMNVDIRGDITAVDARLAEIDKALADADTQPNESKE